MNQIKVPYINLGLQHQPLVDEILKEVRSKIVSGQFILGNSVKKFEENFADMHQVKYAVGVANGTDALILGLKALRISSNDEVITCPNSFLASASSIVMAGAKPVFCDVTEDMNMDPVSLEKKITENTKAIIPVHLTGKPAPMEAIIDIANKYNLYIIEDAAQAVGAKLNAKSVGSYGILSCFSLHPLKNLSSCGDGGIITTNDKKIYEYLIQARNHGLINRDECSFFSINSRLDEIQAAILNVKLYHVSDWNERRREIAEKYNSKLASVVTIPKLENNEYAVYHTYIIQTSKRDQLQEYLLNKGIETKIHYPIPIHHQKSWKDLFPEDLTFPMVESQSKEILSLPIYPELTNSQVENVIDEILQFFNLN